MSDTKALEELVSRYNWMEIAPYDATYQYTPLGKPEWKQAAAELEQLRAENAEMREALEFIGDLAFDRDGWKSAKKLGELIDEIYDYARLELS